MIRLFNTFELVIPLWRYIITYLNSQGFNIEAIIVARKYRVSSELDNPNYRSIKIPYLLSRSKIISHCIYIVLVPLHILLKKSQLNIFYTQPPLFFIIGGAISRLRRIPYVIYIMDFYPYFFYSTYNLKKNGLLARTLNHLTKKSLGRAYKIITIGRCMEKKVLELGIPPKKILFIPNITDQSIGPIEDKDNQFFNKNEKWKDKFIILYAGNMGRAHIFDTILKTAKELTYDEEILFVFAGKGYRRFEVEDEIKKGLRNCVLVDEVPTEYFSHLLSAGKLHYISLRTDFTGLVVPSKFYSSLAVGSPILYEGQGEISYKIQEFNLGKVIKQGDHLNLTKAILSYKNDRGLLERHSKNSSALFNKEYIHEVYLTKYFPYIKKEIIDSLEIKQAK